MARDQLEEARATYASLLEVRGGRTFGAHGLADLFLYKGRLIDAVAALEPAILAETSAAARGRLQLALAEARLAEGRNEVALKLLDAVQSADRSTRFETARLMVAAGRPISARSRAAELRNEVDTEAQALGAILEAEVALASGDARTALASLAAAHALADSWLLRYTQGRAFLAAGRYAEADSEFDLCFRRQGEAVAVFLDDIPTWRVTASLHYHQGVARAGLGSVGAPQSFKEFLAIKEGGDETGGLVADARKRVGDR